jgi:hypothetical protein
LIDLFDKRRKDSKEFPEHIFRSVKEYTSEREQFHQEFSIASAEELLIDFIQMVEILMKGRLGRPEKGTAEPSTREAKTVTIIEAAQLKNVRDEFRRDLLSSFQQEPVESGYYHPADDIIKEGLKSFKTLCHGWIQSIFFDNFDNTIISAGILLCLGNLDIQEVKPWGIDIAIKGLTHSSSEVREAAVEAFELWGGQESLDALKEYVVSEKVSRLKNYVQEVIKDLSQTRG